MNDDLETNGQDCHEAKVHDDGPVLQWRCHPMKRRPWVSVAVTVFVALVVVLVYYGTERSQAFATLAMVVMFASLAKFYFPTSYKLTDDKIYVKTTTQTLIKEWSIYRSCHPDKNGILLSPFTRPTRLENFRGLYLMFSENRDDVVSFVKARVSSTAKHPVSSDKEPKV
ncbi:MAG: hypothetical protein KOO62_02120 [candidate division Zixibacteria bacterium]|nr:hypothetical protein [candidate division Zixibacteria bacterium]